MLVIQCHVFSNFPQQFFFRSIYLVNIFPLVPDTLYWHRGWNIGRHTAISRYRDRNWARSRNRIWAGKGKKQGRGPLHLSMHRLEKDQKNLGDSWKDNWSMRCPFWLQSGQEVLYCTRPQGHLRPLLLYIKKSLYKICMWFIQIDIDILFGKSVGISSGCLVKTGGHWQGSWGLPVEQGPIFWWGWSSQEGALTKGFNAITPGKLLTSALTFSTSESWVHNGNACLVKKRYLLTPEWALKQNLHYAPVFQNYNE